MKDSEEKREGARGFKRVPGIDASRGKEKEFKNRLLPERVTRSEAIKRAAYVNRFLNYIR